jgi:Uma2 family endonuclease
MAYKQTPCKITDASYEKSNRKMRSEYTSETGKKLGKRLTSGKNKRRVSFACRFAGMKGPMKKPNGEPTRKARALKKWGFGSVGAASSFCSKNKEK